jgi:hypothetical protein
MSPVCLLTPSAIWNHGKQGCILVLQGWKAHINTSDEKDKVRKAKGDIEKLAI